jgi:hypothetical protein
LKVVLTLVSGDKLTITGTNDRDVAVYRAQKMGFQVK